ATYSVPPRQRRHPHRDPFRRRVAAPVAAGRRKGALRPVHRLPGALPQVGRKTLRARLRTGRGRVPGRHPGAVRKCAERQTPRVAGQPQNVPVCHRQAPHPVGAAAAEAPAGGPRRLGSPGAGSPGAPPLAVARRKAPATARRPLRLPGIAPRKEPQPDRAVLLPAPVHERNLRFAGLQKRKRRQKHQAPLPGPAARSRAAAGNPTVRL
ncbi:MAG: hypothetical protein AVDCRST_MAG56-6532, partial [uncultured Cytophagales bacterium]